MNPTYYRIKELCDRHGIKLSVLAGAIGIRSSVFTELKMGRTKQLSAQTMRRIADYFEVSVDSLLPETQDDAVEQKRDELYRKRRLLFDLSEKATETELDTIIRVVNALIAEA